jgi:hypothetical protein
MEEVRKHFESYAREGTTLSLEQLEAFCKKKRLKCDKKRLRRLRHEFKYTAFASRYRKPARYMSSSIRRYGVVQVDMANFMPSMRRKNRSYGAFLIGVEMVSVTVWDVRDRSPIIFTLTLQLSGQMAAVPCKDLTKRSWIKACTQMARYSFNSVSVMQSDLDAAIQQSGYFTDLMKRKFDISWQFLRYGLAQWWSGTSGTVDVVWDVPDHIFQPPLIQSHPLQGKDQVFQSRKRNPDPEASTGHR